MIDSANHVWRWHDHGIGSDANLDSKPYGFKKEFSLCFSLLLIQPLVLPASYICFTPYYPFSSVSVIPPGPTPSAGLSLVFLSLISCFSSCYLLYQLQSSHISSSRRLFKKGRGQCTQRGCIGRTTCRIYLGRATTSSCGSPLPHSCCNTDDSFFSFFFLIPALVLWKIKTCTDLAYPRLKREPTYRA